MFPEIIKIAVINKDTNLPISNIAVSITLYANKKSDYDFIPLITDNSGVAEYDKASIKNFIDKTIGIFPMDYNSPLFDCKPIVKIIIMDTKQVMMAINGMTLWKEAYNIPQNIINQLLEVDNGKYISAIQTVELSNQDDICIEFKLMPVS